jgi:hypothetical protein
LFLPYDQGLEHGPRDFFADPVAADPKYIVRLALAGKDSFYAVHNAPDPRQVPDTLNRRLS